MPDDIKRADDISNLNFKRHFWRPMDLQNSRKPWNGDALPKRHLDVGNLVFGAKALHDCPMHLAFSKALHVTVVVPKLLRNALTPNLLYHVQFSVLLSPVWHKMLKGTFKIILPTCYPPKNSLLAKLS